jgi:hypothetical protein
MLAGVLGGVSYAGCTYKKMQDSQEGRVAEKKSDEPIPLTRFSGNVIGQQLLITAFDPETKTVHSVVLHIGLDEKKKFTFKLNGTEYEVDYKDRLSKLCVGFISTIEKPRPGEDTVITSKPLNGTTMLLSDDDLAPVAISVGKQLNEHPDNVTLHLPVRPNAKGCFAEKLMRQMEAENGERVILRIRLLKK